MEKEIILPKIYSASTGVIAFVVLPACIVCNWSAVAVLIAVLASAIISLPATLSLHFLLWLSGKIQLEKGFAWMVLFASVPLLAFIAAWLFAEYVPGKTGFILLLGMASAYSALLVNGISVSRLFNSHDHER